MDYTQCRSYFAVITTCMFCFEILFTLWKLSLKNLNWHEMQSNYRPWQSVTSSFIYHFLAIFHPVHAVYKVLQRFSLELMSSWCGNSLKLGFSLSASSSMPHSQAVEEVSRGQIQPADQLYELKALQDSGRKQEYLAQVRRMEGYGQVRFPHCPCDSRKGGHVMAVVGISSFKLHACKEDGTPEVHRGLSYTPCLSYLWSAQIHDFPSVMTSGCNCLMLLFSCSLKW